MGSGLRLRPRPRLPVAHGLGFLGGARRAERGQAALRLPLPHRRLLRLRRRRWSRRAPHGPVLGFGCHLGPAEKGSAGLIRDSAETWGRVEIRGGHLCSFRNSRGLFIKAVVIGSLALGGCATGQRLVWIGSLVLR